MTVLKRILHVDDDPDICTVVNMSLELIGGFKVIQADSGERALEIVSGAAPDLLLLDMMMPGITGIETFARVQLIPGFENTPGIFVSAKGSSLKIPCDLANILGVISKPFDPGTLPDQVSDMWINR